MKAVNLCLSDTFVEYTIKKYEVISKKKKNLQNIGPLLKFELFNVLFEQRKETLPTIFVI